MHDAGIRGRVSGIRIQDTEVRVSLTLKMVINNEKNHPEYT